MAAEEEKKELTDKEELFCQRYLLDFNGAKSARAVGYDAKNARQMAWELLTKPYIQQRITELRDAIGKKFNITRERIALEYSRLAYFDMRQLYDENGNLLPIKDFGDDEAACIAGLKLEEETEYHNELGKEIDDEGNIEYVQRPYRIVTRVKDIKHADKKAALDSLSKLMGFFTDKLALTTPDGSEAVTPVLNITIIQPPKTDEDEPLQVGK